MKKDPKVLNEEKR